eukprot:TRINITY_DN8384_c0_g1_i1.p1 TRINITY_DN8384_c0_g1~~TRINITY_DN8384_c0_g1_i1.p1  ORF type:complete len:450 (-),score=27.37 TRINITY_DN8384_c0_g1_i1:654-2003(-)
MRLREGESVQSQQNLLDPAQQSLADALKVTLRFVQVGMLVLLVLFVFSGVTTVKEGEVGLQLTFGKITGEPKSPGAHFALPTPIGDFVKVDTGTRQINEAAGFWPYLTARQQQQSIEDLGGSSELDPTNDGSLITADGNLAHTQWSIVYRHMPDRAQEFAQNIHPDHEDSIVVYAARQGIIQAVAEVTIDELLKDSGSGPGSVAAQAQFIAQGVLDRINSGIQIEDMVLAQKMAPLAARDHFAAVQSAEANARREIENANREAARILTEMAGSIHEELHDSILSYGEAIEVHEAAKTGGDPQTIEETRLAMDGVLEDIKVLMESNAAGGEVARLMRQARSHRLNQRNRWASAARRFEAKLAQFEANPEVTVQIEWAQAWRELAGKDFVEIMTHPVSAGPLRLRINRDPNILKRLEESFKERMLLESEERRREQQEQAEFKTTTQLLQEG